MNRLARITSLFLFGLLVFAPQLHAQVGQEAGEGGEESFILFNDDDADREDWQQEGEERAERLANPMNINLVTRADLRALGLLDEEQIDEILSLVFVNGPLHSMAELMAVPSLDKRLRTLLSRYFYVAVPETPTRKRWKPVEQQLTTRLDIPLYYRKGYCVSPYKGGYLGTPLYNRVQYRLSAGRHLSVGLRMEKDAGEPFRHNGGWDAYGFAAQLKALGGVDNLVLGDYKVGFGEGLVINQGYGFGKTSGRRKPSGIKPHLGTDEVNFLRGAAITLRLRHWSLSAWGSHRKLDATLNEDGEVQTLRTAAQHRTQSEMDAKRNVRSSHAGLHLGWQHRGFQVGATAYWQHYNRTLAPGTQLYRAYYPKGKDFFVGGIHYGWSNTWFTISGETATNGRSHGVATLNQFAWRPNPTTTLAVLQRHYGRGYSSFYSSALSDRGSVQNESGGMIRLETELFRRISLLTYFDVFRNEWPSRGETQGRRGQELLLQTDTKLGKHHALQLRYQLKRRGAPGHLPVHHRLRARYTWQPNTIFTLNSFANLHNISGENGYSLSQSVRHQSKDKRWTETLMATYYHTPSYDSRVYVPEVTLRSTFSVPALSGQGIRAIASARATLWKKHLQIEARYALTRVLDKPTQGSGMQLINSPWRNDVQVQLTVKL